MGTVFLSSPFFSRGGKILALPIVLGQQVIGEQAEEGEVRVSEASRVSVLLYSLAGIKKILLTPRWTQEEDCGRHC